MKQIFNGWMSKYLAKPMLSDSKKFSTEDVNNILDDYQVECQLKYNSGTVPDAREWFSKKFYLR